MENQNSFLELGIDPLSQNYLRETAKWNRFLGILGFIGSGLLILVGLFFVVAGSSISRSFSGSGMSGNIFSMFGASVGFFYIIIAILFIMPSLYRFNFATKMIKALDANDQQNLTEAFANLKSFSKFFGILAIIYLALVALVFILSIFSAMFR
ncbi:DUF5362 family protein [Chitinophagaceae bacterium LWZ2-11]